MVGADQEWASHREALWDALQLCVKFNKGPVLELGSGPGSTPFLRAFCEENGLKFVSYETNPEYAKFHNSTLVSSIWDAPDWKLKFWGLVFIDHAPGESRAEVISYYANYQHLFDYMVVHDTQPAADHDYKMRDLFKHFTNVKDYPAQVAWTTLIKSNHAPSQP